MIKFENENDKLAVEFVDLSNFFPLQRQWCCVIAKATACCCIKIFPNSLVNHGFLNIFVLRLKFNQLEF